MSHISLPAGWEPTEIEIDNAGQAAELVEVANSFEIKNEEDLGRAADLTNKVNAIFKDIEEQRDEIVRPLFESQREANAIFKVVTEPLKGAERRIRDMMANFRRFLKRQQDELAATQRKEQAKAEREAKKTGVPAPAPPPPPQDNPIMGDLGGKATYIEKWAHELVDITEVPLRFLQPNDAMIKQAIKDGARKIPGLKITDVGTVRTK